MGTYDGHMDLDGQRNPPKESAASQTTSPGSLVRVRHSIRKGMAKVTLKHVDGLIKRHLNQTKDNKTSLLLNSS